MPETYAFWAEIGNIRSRYKYTTFYGKQKQSA